MRPGVKRLFAVGLIAAGVLGLVSVLTGTGSVRDHVADRYAFVGEQPTGEGGGRSLVYHSDDPASETAADIREQFKPADVRATEAGVFLRYSDDIVAVVPDGADSRVLLTRERDGYVFFYPYLGGYWGTYSGPAESFRGGGPGGGK